MKSIWGEPKRDYYWEASLIGDLVCGGCEKTKPVTLSSQTMLADGVPMKAGTHICRSCGRPVILKDEIILLVKQRLSAYPGSIPPTEGTQRWKGEDPYGS